MICEMCGNNVPRTRRMTVQGAVMNLCDNCAKFGDGYKAPSSGDRVAAPTRDVIESRLERRERRMQTKDIYANTTSVQLIGDYGEVIREAREKKGMDIDDFGQSIGVKKITLLKVESGKLVPDDRLIATLEKALDIKLKETVVEGVQKQSSGRNQGMTLANFIKEDKRKK